MSFRSLARHSLLRKQRKPDFTTSAYQGYALLEESGLSTDVSWSCPSGTRTSTFYFDQGLRWFMTGGGLNDVQPFDPDMTIIKASYKDGGTFGGGAFNSEFAPR